MGTTSSDAQFGKPIRHPDLGDEVRSRLPELLLDVFRGIHQVGGRAFLVGGFVRDRLLGIPNKDFDVEVYGLSLAKLEKVLENYGPVAKVGRSFGVLLFLPLDVDFALPRTESKSGQGHRGFVVQADEALGMAEAARRRDLTINSMAWDPLSTELFDTHQGLEDLESKILRATDSKHFGEDPLRALRVMQFVARFEFELDSDLVELCAEQPLDELSAERVRDEFIKLLLKGQRPSLGLRFLKQSQLLKYFTPLQALVGVNQDPEYHPEGDVWTHTLMVVDEAAKIREGLIGGLGNSQEAMAVEPALILMLAALCHDFGKALFVERLPEETSKGQDGGGVKVDSAGHEQVGVPVVEEWLRSLKFSQRQVTQVAALVRHHLDPARFVAKAVSDKAYRRLCRRLYAAQTSPKALYELASADNLGRTTSLALSRDNTLAESFWSRIKTLGLDQPHNDVVLGRHLIARGVQPGPHMKELLDQCREIQDETGLEDPGPILDRVLGKSSP